IVASLLDPVNHLPQVLADFAAPQVTARAVEAVPPELPQAIGPRFRPRACRADKWIVFGNAVALAGLGMIDIEPEELAVNARQVLADLQLVGDTRAVAGGQIEHAVRA